MQPRRSHQNGVARRAVSPLLGLHAILSLSAAALGLIAAGASAGTIVSGDVSGVWDLPGSPYWVEGDLLVQTGNTLAIDAGVEVRYRGPYRLLVNGELRAIGTEADSILFTRDEPTPLMEWRGIRLVGADNATHLAYCRIEHVRSADNYPDVRGGGIYCEACSPKIRHCLLQYNLSHNGNSNGMGGGVACVGASPLIEYCIMRDNEADSGGGIATIEECSPVIRNNLITENTAPYSGGGIYAGVRSSPVIENNIITDNAAYGWGGGGMTLWNFFAMNHIAKTVRNNIVAGNTTTAKGGGFYIRYDQSILDNNTVVGNHAAQQGGGVYVLNQGAGDYPPHLRNFIIWGNTAGAYPSIYPDASTGAVVYVTYSDVEGDWSGIGNIDADPEFADALYHLTAASLCVDAGDPTPLDNDACFPPSQGSERNDMGAYGGPLACEWGSGTVGIDVATINGRGRAPAFGRLLHPGAPNPFGASSTIEFDLPAAAPVTLRIYSVAGRLVRRLVEERIEAAGTVRLEWDGRDDAGRRVRSGVYLVCLTAGELRDSQRVIVVR